MIARDELLFAVDESNKPVFARPRRFVHANKIWHRTSHIWIISNKNQVMCQQRSFLKDMNPGKWEPFFGGHLLSGQSYKDSAYEELNEELGIDPSRREIKFLFINKSDRDKEFQAVHYIKWFGKISSLKLEKDEVVKVKWISFSQLLKIYKRNDKRWTAFNYEVPLLEKFLKLAY